MTYRTDSVKLAAAQRIFEDANIEAITIGDKVAGYKANLMDKTFENTSLTDLCIEIVEWLQSWVT
ncbi:MAG: hypothetical protein F6K19_45945 [Cyanothece sp. SIO1E1]|nr:hypothetical protein [Cyanothece sp. SIO1E1]